MSTFALASRPAGHAREAALVLGGIVLLTVSAKLQVPFWPVPVTLQTLAIFLVALAYPPRAAMASVLAYLGAGLAGLPVFAGALSGPAYFMGPTAGFLFGFVALAGLVQLARRAGLVRGMLSGFAVLVGADAVLFALGAAWLGWGYLPASGAPLGLHTALAIGVAPFVLADLIKAGLAAALATKFHPVKPSGLDRDAA